MIKLILLIGLFQYIGYFINKSKKREHLIGCGIFAWAGKSMEPDDKNEDKTLVRFNKSKFDILGIINETRGTDSCGVTTDGEIYNGVDTTKVYRNFITQTGYNKPKKVPTVIGHTRKSTVGANSINNAHPFGFGKVGDGYEFIGVHNGTLINHDDLAKEYKVSTTSKNVTSKNVEIIRHKIDSEILLECIYKSKNFKILSEYNGAAALIFTNLNEPNVLYCYHGLSKKSKHSTVLEEERPLFYYRENKHSLYISSIKGSLFTIGGTEKTVKSFEYNTVYKITDGDIDNAEVVKISRKDNYQSYYGSTANNYYGYGNGWTNDDCEWPPIVKDNGKKDTAKTSQPSNYYNLYNETLVKDYNKTSQVYFNKLRYWQDKKLITGVYTWIKGYGFYYLGRKPKEAETTFWGLVNIGFKDGDFDFIGDEKDVIIPFIHTTKNEITEPIIFYFFEGVMMKTSLDYVACVQLSERGKKFDYTHLSEASTHPIMDNTYITRPDNLQNIMFEGKIVNNIICPLGADRIYTIEKGNCVKHELVKKPILLPTLSKVEIELRQNEERAKKKEEEKDDDLLEKDIEDIFTNNYKSFPLYIKKLKVYNSPRAKQAIAILETFMKDATTLVAIETL